MKIHNIFTIRSFGLLSLGLGILLLSILPLYKALSTEKTADDATVVNASEQGQPYYLAKGVMPLRVSGTISNTDEVVIRAQTSGTIHMYVKEGDRVNSGTVMAKQQLPVAQAQLALSSAQRTVSSMQQQLSVAQAEVSLEKQDAVTNAAKSLIELRTENNTNRISEARSGLLTTLEGTVLVTSQALDYVDNNRSLFTADGMRQYRDIVAELHNQFPNYLSGGITYSIGPSENLLSVLYAMQQEEDLESTQDILKLAENMERTLRSVTEVLRTGEQTVYDERTIIYSGSNYEMYATIRSSVLETHGDLISAITALRSAVDANNEDLLQQRTSVSTTALDQEHAKTVLQYTEKLTQSTDDLTRAQEGVYEAQLSLASVRAPFSGIVSNIMVEDGEYVTSGTPLFSLHGTGAQEVTVSVPTRFLATLKIGQEFSFDDTLIGFVDRFAPVASLGAVEVTISLQGSNFVSGETLTGTLLLEHDESDIYQIPREYIFFNSTGPYIRYKNTETSPVAIVYDDGEHLYATVKIVLEETLSHTEQLTTYGK